MFCVLYVGNYPSEFSRNDVAHIFRDFDGVKVKKYFKRETKSFSFLDCKDIDQVVTVIRQMNNVFVSGRKLIVRASDEKLQEYVELLLRETGDDIEVSQKSVSDADKTKLEKANHGNAEEFRREKSCIDSPPFVPLQVLRNKSYRKPYKNNSSEQFEKKSCHSSSSSLHSHPCEHNYVDAADSSEFGTASTRSSNSLNRQDDDSEFTWVSVTNFPLGTNKRSIYELFSDYSPIDVRMICNQARKDRTLTEAHVCFLNRDTADDVILNFDNTMYNGRLLLVNDTQDLTVMNELLNVLHI